MKRSEIWFNLIAVPVDILMLFIAGFTAFYLRPLVSSLVGPVQYLLSFNEFFYLSSRLVPIIILLLAAFGLYNLKGTKPFRHEFTRVLSAISMGLLVVIVGFFFNKSLFPSRFIVLAAWGLAVTFVLIGRFVLKNIQLALFKKGLGLHNVVLVNGNNKDAKVLEKVFKDTSYGYRVVKEIDFSDGIWNTLEQLCSQYRIDEIIQANATVEYHHNLKLALFARSRGLQFSFVPNLFDVQRNSVETVTYKGVPIISLKNTPLDGWGKIVKRLVDIILSSTALVILSPVYLLVYLAIKIDSPGPAIYGALRGGNGKDFRFYKFRSMYTHLSVGDEYGGNGAEEVRQQLWKQNDRGGADAPFLKIKQDPRVTRVGRFTRKTKLDELPQFWNVLKGDMSLVGPRAHVLDEVERYRKDNLRMFSIKPGIFGVTQLHQLNNPELPFAEEMRLNTYYIENWSLWLDIKILSQTAIALLFKQKPSSDY